MRTALFVSGALAVMAAAASPAQGQQGQIGRTELTHRDFGDEVHEVIQVRVDFGPGATFPKHSHPGVEIAYVLEGTLEYQLEDRPPVRLKPGDSLFIPAGAAHSARNVGSGGASELATYVVQMGKPLVVTAP
jgi:quercetin dioxygenase-like cupin family protein